jgi:tetratricopeptide (TPR) repeat protein
MEKLRFIIKLLIAYAFLWITDAKAQDIDSLKNIISNKKVHDTTKLSTILILINNSYDENEYKRYIDLMGRIAKKNLADAKNEGKLRKEYTRYLASYYSNLTVVLQEEGSPKAFESIDKAITLYQSLNETSEFYACLVTKGVLLYRNKDYKEAIAYQYRALKYFEKNEKENIDNLWYVNLNLGTIYTEQNQVEEAIKFFKKAIYYFDKKGDKITVDDQIQESIIFMNIGTSYIALKQFDKATDFLNKSIMLSRTNKDNYRTALALGRLGLIDMKYQRLNAAADKFNEAINLSDNPISTSYALVNLGKVYYHTNQKVNAATSLEKGLTLAQSIPWNDLIKDASELLYKINKEKGKYKEAVEMLELFQKLNDNSKIEENKNELKQQQLQYDYEKKEFKYKLESQRKNTEKNNLLFGLSSVLLLLLIGAYFLYRNYKHKQAISIFEKNELNQKLLLTQMNPHFIFNSIDNIQSLIYNKQEKDAVNYLTKFSKLTRQILENSNESYVSFSEELAMIDNYLVIQQLLYNNKFNFSIDVDEAIDPESIVVPPMLTQPFIENAIKHGLKNKTDNGFITIRFYWQEKQLIFEVCDNGIGFNNDEKSTGNKSLAMKITKERLANISKKSDFEIHTQNLFDADKQVVGAKVYFDIPYLYEN